MFLTKGTTFLITIQRQKKLDVNMFLNFLLASENTRIDHIIKDQCTELLRYSEFSQNKIIKSYVEASVSEAPSPREPVGLAAAMRQDEDTPTLVGENSAAAGLNVSALPMAPTELIKDILGVLKPFALSGNSRAARVLNEIFVHNFLSGDFPTTFLCKWHSAEGALDKHKYFCDLLKDSALSMSDIVKVLNTITTEREKIEAEQKAHDSETLERYFKSDLEEEVQGGCFKRLRMFLTGRMLPYYWGIAHFCVLAYMFCQFVVVISGVLFLTGSTTSLRMNCTTINTEMVATNESSFEYPEIISTKNISVFHNTSEFLNNQNMSCVGSSASVSIYDDIIRKTIKNPYVALGGVSLGLLVNYGKSFLDLLKSELEAEQP